MPGSGGRRRGRRGPDWRGRRPLDLFGQRLDERRELRLQLAVDSGETLDRPLELVGHRRRDRRLASLLKKPVRFLLGRHHDTGRLELGVGQELSGPLLGIGNSVVDMILGPDKELPDLHLGGVLVAG